MQNQDQNQNQSQKSNNQSAKKQDYEVKAIRREDCEEYILRIHYARRWPSITWAFGLFLHDELCGIVTYGTPPSHPLRTMIAGLAYSSKVIELNRLCLKYNRKNEASLLVSKSIKLLPQNKIIVSFADVGQGHAGCVYQATNFIYTGLSAPGNDYKIHSKPGLHFLTVLDEFRGKGVNRAEALKKKYGDELYTEPKTRKHRYIFLHGSRKFKRNVMEVFRYKSLPYPKATMSLEELDATANDVKSMHDAHNAAQLSPEDFNDLII